MTKNTKNNLQKNMESFPLMVTEFGYSGITVLTTDPKLCLLQL